MSDPSGTGITSTISSKIFTNSVGAITASVLASVLIAIVAWVVANFQPTGAVVAIEQYSPPHHGSGDATAALDSALAQCAANGGGLVELGPFGYDLLSANITIPQFCTIDGQFFPGGAQLTNDYTGLPFSLHLNPAFTITASRNSGIEGVSIVASNLTVPTTLQGIASAVAAYAGTALSIGPAGSSVSNNGNDVTVRDLFIIGFNQCINQNWADRARGSNVYGDCTNGLSINQSNDVSRWQNVHFWNFISQNETPSLNVVTLNVSGAASDGGLIEITTATAHPFVTGNPIVISEVAGTTEANGLWTVTVIDSTHFTLNGSAFVNAYSSGGEATLDNTLRAGTAFLIENSAYVEVSDSFAFGFVTGAHAGAGCIWCSFTNDSLDGVGINYSDPANVGYLIDGNADRTHVIGGFISSAGSPIIANSTQTRPQSFVGVSIGATNLNGPQVLQGSLQIEGGDITGGSPLFIADAATALTLTDVWGVAPQAGGSPINVQSAADAAKLSVKGPLNTPTWFVNGAGNQPAAMAINTDTSGTNGACFGFGSGTGPFSSTPTASICGGTSGSDYLGFFTGSNTERMQLTYDGSNTFDLTPFSGSTGSLGTSGNHWANVFATNYNFPPVTISALGSCAAGNAGQAKYVKDTVASAAATFHSTIAGGGSTTVAGLATCNGTAWQWG